MLGLFILKTWFASRKTKSVVNGIKCNTAAFDYHASGNATPEVQRSVSCCILELTLTI